MMGTFQPVETRQPNAVAQPTYDAADLAKGGDRALIVLNGQTYVLRITRSGKLILTK